MGLVEVLARCHEEGVSLKIGLGGDLRRSPNASAELAALLKAHREELKAIVGSQSWPWLGQVGFVLAEARCKCGKRPWQFTALGEPVCEEPGGTLDLAK